MFLGVSQSNIESIERERKRKKKLCNIGWGSKSTWDKFESKNQFTYGIRLLTLENESLKTIKYIGQFSFQFIKKKKN